MLNNIDKYCGQECPIECDTISYPSIVSFSQYQSDDYHLEDLLNYSFIGKKYPQMTKEELKQSMLTIKVYYTDLARTEIIQVLKNTTWDLVSSIGGSLGLFIGASILSFFEILELVLNIIASTCWRLVTEYATKAKKKRKEKHLKRSKK